MSAYRISGVSANDVDVSSSHNMFLRLANGTSAMGGAAAVGGLRIFTENDTGSITGEPDLYSPGTSDDYKLFVGMDHVQDSEVFTYTSQNTGKFSYLATTMAMNQASQTLNTNSGNIVTVSTGVAWRTRRMFPLFGQNNSTEIVFVAAFSAVIPTNTVLDFGQFIPGATNPFAPTDGVFFRATSSGLSGVVSFNGVETTTGLALPPAYFGTGSHTFAIVASQSLAGFFVDRLLVGKVPISRGNGSIYASWALPVAIRHAIINVAASHAFSFKVRSYTIGCVDLSWDKDFASQMSGSGQSYQGQSGQTMGSVSNYANSTNPTSAAAANGSAAAGTTGLGGHVIITNPSSGGGSTDLIVNSYQNPAGTVASPGKTLYIKGAWVSAYSSGATTDATTQTCIMWSLAYGSLTANLGASESASFTSGTTKAPRIVPLGFMSAPLSAVVGSKYLPGLIYRAFEVPIPVNPGEFLLLVGKIVAGAATASQTATIINGYDYYWE